MIANADRALVAGEQPHLESEQEDVPIPFGESASPETSGLFSWGRSRTWSEAVPLLK